MTLQELFNNITTGATVCIDFSTKKEYDSVRVMLLTKFRKMRDICSSIGMEEYEDKYVQAEWAGSAKLKVEGEPKVAGGTGTFKLLAKENAKRTAKEFKARIL